MHSANDGAVHGTPPFTPSSRLQNGPSGPGLRGAPPDDLREIERAVSEIAMQGVRYSESSQRMIDR